MFCFGNQLHLLPLQSIVYKMYIGVTFLYIKQHYLFLILYNIKFVYVRVNKPIWLSEMWLTFSSTWEVMGFDLLGVPGIVLSKLKFKIVTSCYTCSIHGFSSINTLCPINRFSITNVVIFI